MPHIDKKTGEIVLRVVYDGAPEAGKTTNIRRLGKRVSLQRRGKLESPGSTGRRTEFFDWLDFAGGYIDGKSVRCQIVSVPGQPSLLRRRKYLLKAADVVVFVADSKADLVERNRVTFSLLERALERTGTSLVAPIVLQANKQDLEDALSPIELQRQLEISPATPVFAAEAETGVGVMQTFLMAVRLATDRIRELILRNELGTTRADADSPEELYQALLEASSIQAAIDDVRAPRLEVPSVEDVSLEDDLDGDDEEDPVSTPVPRVSRRKQATTIVDALFAPRVPNAQTIPAGCFWPPVQGRSTLASINAAGANRVDEPWPWSPNESIEYRTDNGWVLHTCSAWVFDDLDRAREHLVRTVRTYLSRGCGVPEGRTLLVAPEGDQSLFWMVTPQVETLDQHVRRALVSVDRDEVIAALRATARAVDSFARQIGEGQEEFPGLSHVAVQGGNVFDMRIPGRESYLPASSVDPAAEVRTLVVELMSENAAIEKIFREAITRIDTDLFAR